MHISTIALPDGVTPTITDRDFTVATIASPGGGLKNEDEEDGEIVEETTEDIGNEDSSERLRDRPANGSIMRLFWTGKPRNTLRYEPAQCWVHGGRPNCAHS